MADEPASSDKGGGGTFGFLGRKVGPFPVIVWGAIAAGVYYWYTHYGPGAANSGNATGQPLGNPEVVVVQGPRGRPGPRGGPSKRKPKKRKRKDVTTMVRPTAPRAASPGAAPVITQPGQVATSQAPVYDEWSGLAGDTTVPDPQMAYAPMTAGSVYG